MPRYWPQARESTGGKPPPTLRHLRNRDVLLRKGQYFTPAALKRTRRQFLVGRLYRFMLPFLRAKAITELRAKGWIYKRGKLVPGVGAGAGAGAGLSASAGEPACPRGDAQEEEALQVALLESAREEMLRRAMQQQREADEETVDRFTRHAESGFFGDSSDFVLDGDY